MDKKIVLKSKISGYAKTQTVFQMEASECGAACLAMILSYYGKHVALEEVREAVAVSRDGSKAGNIMRAATRYGMEVHGYRKEIDKLLQMKPPFIIHWNFNHFVVYEGVKKGKIQLNDPAVGHRSITLEEFDSSYTGIVISAVPNESFEKQKRSASFIKLALERVKGNSHAMLSLILIGLLLVFPGYLMASYSQVFIDRIFVEGNVDFLGSFLLLMALTLAIQIFFQMLHNKILLRLQNKMSLISAHKFLVHMFRLPMSFFEQRYAGDIAGRIENNDNVSTFVGGQLTSVCINLIESFFYLLILVIYSPLLTLIAIAGLLINLFLIIYASGKLKEISMKLNQDSGKLLGMLYAGLSIADSLKAAGGENEFTGRLLGNYAKSINSEQRMQRTQQILNAVPQAVMSVLNVLLLMAGSLLVIQGDMTIGMMVAFTTLFATLLTPINQLTGFVFQIQMTKTDMNRVKDIMEYREEQKYQKEDSLQDLCKLKGEVRIQGLSFGYNSASAPVIANFNMHVESGKSVAIIGASGSGKSTIAKLICSLYEPWEGSILIDNAPLGEISNDSIHLSIADVSQNITIFKGSVRDNITLWNHKIPEEDIIRAAKDACIHDLIASRPGGYDYMVNEGGTCFSGGQRQRLEIARALALNPSIIIMDEATSALDAIIEQQVLDNVKKRGCTCIVVAHRLSAIRDCDEIIVLRHGLIAERGTHAYLMENGKLYQKLIQLS